MRSLTDESMNNLRCLVIIPAFNEEKRLYPLIKSIVKMGHLCMVIDDGSKDNTASVAKKAGALVFSNKKNQGKGAAISRGLKKARKIPFDFLILMDGDGQHRPKEITNFTKNISPTTDLLVGNRMIRPKNMPPIRFITNKICSYLTSILCRRYIPDSQCGFRLLTRNFALELKLEKKRFQVETEILYLASKTGKKIDFIPISCHYDKRRESKIHPLLDVIRFLAYYFSCFFTVRLEKDKLLF